MQENQAAEPAMKTEELFFSLAEKAEHEAIAKSEKLALDTRYSKEYKHEQFQKNIHEALEWITTNAAATEESLNRAIARYTPLAAVQIAPSLEEAAALSYTKDVVMNQWQAWAKANHKVATIGANGGLDAFGKVSNPTVLLGTKYPQEIAQAWRSAIAAGDKITARVYRDFAESFLRQAKGLEPDEPLPANLAFVSELQEKSLDMLRTDEQKQAAKRLRQANYDLSQLKTTVIGAQFRLGNARLGTDGKITQKPQFNIQF